MNIAVTIARPYDARYRWFDGNISGRYSCNGPHKTHRGQNKKVMTGVASGHTIPVGLAPQRFAVSNGNRSGKQERGVVSEPGCGE